MNEFCSLLDRRVCEGGMDGPDAPTDTAPRFENRYSQTRLAERLRACDSSNSGSGNRTRHAAPAINAG